MAFVIRKKLLSLFFALIYCGLAMAQAITLSDSAVVSLMTCTPGDEVYSKYGHSAIRVKDPARDIDVTFNYGIFNFHTEHFYSKFVRGETWYQLGIQSTPYFIMDSKETGRDTYEQVLNLSQSEKQSLFDALEVNSRPENMYYLYNFVFDNCATRPFLLLQKSMGEKFNTPKFDLRRDTYRDMVTYYSEKNSWAGFGINLVFGKDADVVMTPQQRLFLPEQLMNYVSEATKKNGEPLCLKENVRPFDVKEHPWFGSPYMAILLAVILIAALTVFDMVRSRKSNEVKISWWFDGILIFVGFVLGTIMFYLSYFSIHPLVGHNWNLLLVNPLPVILFVAVLIPAGRRWLKKYFWIIGLYLVLAFIVRSLCGQTMHWLMIVPAFYGLRVMCLTWLKKSHIEKKSRKNNSK